MRKKSEPVLHLAFWLLLFALSVSITSRIFPLLKAIMGSGFAMLLLSGVAAHAGGNLKRQEVSFVMCYVMSGIGAVGVVVGFVVWLVRAIF